MYNTHKTSALAHQLRFLPCRIPAWIAGVGLGTLRGGRHPDQPGDDEPRGADSRADERFTDFHPMKGPMTTADASGHHRQ